MVRKSSFKPDPEGINPEIIPVKYLYTGNKIPVIGLGTFGSDYVTPLQVANAVREAILLGYRHIDCASVYGNEREIGLVLDDFIIKGINRKELWITSKVWNNMHGEGPVIESCKKTLEDIDFSKNLIINI